MTDQDIQKAYEVVCGSLAYALKDAGSTIAEIEMSIDDVDYKLTFEKVGNTND
jgi:hypothetical protein